MKDYKLRDLRASHTLGWSWYKVNNQASNELWSKTFVFFDVVT